MRIAFPLLDDTFPEFFYYHFLVYKSTYSDAFPHDLTESVVFQALNEISEREGDPEYPEEEMGGGSLLR